MSKVIEVDFAAIHAARKLAKEGQVLNDDDVITQSQDNPSVGAALAAMELANTQLQQDMSRLGQGAKAFEERLDTVPEAAARLLESARAMDAEIEILNRETRLIAEELRAWGRGEVH